MNPDIQEAGQKAINNIKSNANLARDPKTIGAVFAYVDDLEAQCGLRESPAPAAADSKSDKKKSK